MNIETIKKKLDAAVEPMQRKYSQERDRASRCINMIFNTAVLNSNKQLSEATKTCMFAEK